MISGTKLPLRKWHIGKSKKTHTRTHKDGLNVYVMSLDKKSITSTNYYVIGYIKQYMIKLLSLNMTENPTYIIVKTDS